MVLKPWCWAGLWLATALSMAHAANTPCSGRKGGISHCMGSEFVCNDGSVSASRKVCTAASTASARATPAARPPAGSAAIALGHSEKAPAAPARPLLPSHHTAARAMPATAATAHDCSCRSGQFCTGPRGGTYCLSDSGRKSYLRK